MNVSIPTANAGELKLGAPDLAAVSRGKPAFGSSFYLAMRILPRARREAMFAIYAFCRIVDDIADEPGPMPERIAAMAVWRHEIDALYAGSGVGQAAFLAEAIDLFGLPQEDFLHILEGMNYDLRSQVRIHDEDELDWYCDRVASAVGRLSSRIFGLPVPEGEALAYHLGRALQITNILRDIDEDARNDRLYIPRSLLDAAGVQAHEIQAVISDPALGKACAPLVEQAATHFAAASDIMAARPASETKAPRLMAMAYQSVLKRLSDRGFSAPRAPVKVSKGPLLVKAFGVWLSK